MTRTFPQIALPAILFAVAACVIASFWWWLGQDSALPASPFARGEKLQCVSYAPFRGAQNPLSDATRIEAAQIDDDLARLSRLTDCVRTYSVQHGLDQIPDIARRHRMKVIHGIWLSSNAEKNRAEIDTSMRLAKQFPDVIQSIVVGNEVLLRGELSGPDLAGVIRTVKAQTGVPVTYADVWEFWLRHREVYEAVDFVTIHILPYWEDFPIPARDAAAHVDEIRRKMVAAFPNKEILIGETGFPSQGRMREGALPSPVNQARVLHEVLALAKRDNFRVNLIEAFDQPWKRYLEGTVGGYWGLLDADTRRFKFGWGEPLSNHPAWRWQAAGGVALAAAIFAFAFFAQRRPATPMAWFGVLVTTVFAGSMIGLTVEKAAIESFNAGGWTRALAFAALSIAAPVVAAIAMVRDIPVPLLAKVLARRGERISDPLALALGLAMGALVVLALHAALGLVFDPRYRDFPYTPMTASVVPFALLAAFQAGRKGARGAAELLAAFVLTLSLLYIAFNESVANWQSLWLCATFLLLSLILFRARDAQG
jgi:glucan 1,3-beta-glucosidase